MSSVDRLDFSKPPPGLMIGWRKHPAMGELWHFDNVAGERISWAEWSEERRAIAAAWAHYKARHDPPGMWSGYCAVLPLCDQYRPRMGVSIPGVAHLELYVNAERPGTCEEAKAMGRAAAWDHYVDAVEIANIVEDGKLDSGPPYPTWFEPYAWPRPLRWTSEQRAEIRRLCTEGGDWSEVLRGI